MTYILGVDPGPMTGLVAFEVGWPIKNPVIIQCSWNAFDDVLAALHRGDLVLAVEAFVIGPRSARLNDPCGARAARAVAQRCEHYAQEHGLRCFVRSAVEVKRWATDQRLLAARLLEPCTGMRHARDAARHALFAAVRTCGMVDPLSRRAGAA